MIDRLVSVVVPAYDEEGNLAPLYERLAATLRRITRRHEIIFVDNGSRDGTAAVLGSIAAQDPDVVVISYSRNFGSQGAVTGGLDHARGDCVVVIDGDLQDPPELIEAFVQKWQEGFDIVYGVRAKRPEGIVRRAGYRAFYRILRRISSIDIPLDASDFALMDRRVVDTINSFPERERFVRWIRAWAGFRHTGIPYARDPRHSGRSKMSMLENARWAQSAFLTFSAFPLELITYLLLMVTGFALLGIGYFTVARFREDIPHGVTSIIVITLGLGVIQLLALSIIGGYVGKILIEVKRRPTYIVREVHDHRGRGRDRKVAVEGAMQPEGYFEGENRVPHSESPTSVAEERRR